jgi:hypothetical protein
MKLKLMPSDLEKGYLINYTIVVDWLQWNEKIQKGSDGLDYAELTLGVIAHLKEKLKRTEDLLETYMKRLRESEKYVVEKRKRIAELEEDLNQVKITAKKDE